MAPAPGRQGGDALGRRRSSAWAPGRRSALAGPTRRPSPCSSSGRPAQDASTSAHAHAAAESASSGAAAAAGVVAAEGGAGVDCGANCGGGGEAQPPAVLWRCCPHLPAQKEISLVLCPPFVRERHQSAAIYVARFHCTLRESSRCKQWAREP